MNVTSRDVGPTVDMEIRYNLLDDVVELQQEISQSRSRSIKIHYDASQRPVLLQTPVSVAGSQLGNQMSYEWDAQDRVAEVYQGHLSQSFF